MMYNTVRSLIPGFLVRHLMHFEAAIGDAVVRFGGDLPNGSRVLDAGAGEGQYRKHFARQVYVGLDLGVGDGNWDYSHLDVRGDLEAAPFADASFDAAISIVTLEHVRHPEGVLAEIARVLRPGGCLLIVVPHEWEEHQEPHDYYRYTRYGIRFLLEQAGLSVTSLEPVGGVFRLLSRRLLAAAQALPAMLGAVYLAAVAIPALLLPFLDRFDRRRNFTLGYICIARKPS